MQAANVVETGEAREVMHFALLLGYGASAVNPYMAFAVIDRLVKDKEIQLDYHTAEKNYLKAVNKGLLKVISKMGISTMGSYRGAQLFEAVGVSQELIDRYFCGTTSKIGGVTLEEIYRDIVKFHTDAYVEREQYLDHNGIYSFRKNGEYHAWNPETTSTLPLATRM